MSSQCLGVCSIHQTYTRRHSQRVSPHREINRTQQMLACLSVAYGFCQTQGNKTQNPQHTCPERFGDMGPRSLSLTGRMFVRAVLKASLVSQGLSHVPLLGRSELRSQGGEESGSAWASLPKARGSFLHVQLPLHTSKWPWHEPPRKGRVRLLCVWAGVPELQQRLLPEDARGQGQLGAVLGEQPGSGPALPAFLSPLSSQRC